MPEIKLVSKLSIATIKANPRKVANLPEGQSLKLAMIYGMASGIKVVEDKTTGVAHEALTGQFEATNMESGDIIRSGVLYLPKGIHETLVAEVKKLDEDSTATVDFALEIRAVQAKNPIGYSYEAVPLIKPTETDPLEELRKKLPAFKALAPVPAAKMIEAQSAAAKKTAGNRR